MCKYAKKKIKKTKSDSKNVGSKRLRSKNVGVENDEIIKKEENEDNDNPAYEVGIKPSQETYK